MRKADTSESPRLFAAFMNGLLGLRSGSVWLMACCAGLALGVARPASAESGLLVPMKPTVDPVYLPDADPCLTLAESQRRAPRIGTLLDLAACHEAQGKLGLSFSEFTEALALAQGEERRDLVKLARPRVDQLAPRISKLIVLVPEEVAMLAPEVRLDGEPLSAWGVELPLDPGRHRLEAHAEGCAWWSAELKLSAGELRAETVPAPSCGHAPLARPPAPGAVSHIQVRHIPREGWKGQRKLASGLALMGSVAALVALGLELGNDPVHDANPQCGVIAHSGRPYCIGVEHRHEKAAVTLGVGLAALTASAVLWFTATSSCQRVALRVGVAAGALHARVTW